MRRPIRPRRPARRRPPSASGRRSSIRSARRSARSPGTSLTPLQDLAGTITPADLHFTRIHAGIPTIDPAKHTLLIHGLVDRPIEFSVADLKRFPVRHAHALHRMLRQRPLGLSHAQAGDDAAAGGRDDEQQRVDRRSRLDRCSARPACTAARSGFSPRAATRACSRAASRSRKATRRRARRLGAERRAASPRAGVSDSPPAPRLRGQHEREVAAPPQARHRAVHDALGNVEVHRSAPRRKGAACSASRWTRSRSSRAPAYPEKLSARAGGRFADSPGAAAGASRAWTSAPTAATTWAEAELLTPLSSQGAGAFRADVALDGNESLLMSRAVDDQGYVQPTMAQLKAARGPGTDYHFNSHPRLARRARRHRDLRGRTRERAARACPRRVVAVALAACNASTRATTTSATRSRSTSDSAAPRRAAEVAAVNIDVSPNGAGLPGRLRNARAGRGRVSPANCASCHGANGEGKPPAYPQTHRRSEAVHSTSRATSRFRARSATTGRTRRRSSTTSAARCRSRRRAR